MTWFVFSLLSIFAVATAELTQQYILHNKQQFDARASGALILIIQAVLCIPFIIGSNLQNNFVHIFKIELLPYIVIVILASAIGVIFYLQSFNVKNISISIMFVSLSVIVSTTLGIILFQESFYNYKILGILFVLIAIASLNYKSFLIEKNNFYALLAGICFGISYSMDKKIVTSDVNPLVYLAFIFPISATLIFLSSYKTIIKSIRSSKLTDYTPVLISAVGYFLYNLFTFTAYTLGGEVGRIDIINNSEIFVVILAEYFILKNKEGVLRKIITSIVAFTGVAILGML